VRIAVYYWIAVDSWTIVGFLAAVCLLFCRIESSSSFRWVGLKLAQILSHRRIYYEYDIYNFSSGI
jgi:hypothetical protein